MAVVLPAVGSSDHNTVLLHPVLSPSRPQRVKRTTYQRSSDPDGKAMIYYHLKNFNWTSLYYLENCQTMTVLLLGCHFFAGPVLILCPLLYFQLWQTMGNARISTTYYVAHYVWPYHETVRMSVCPSVRLSVCLSVTCHISKTEPDRAIVTMDHYIEVGCN